ncbi:transglutaminase TgpA family protein [Sulfurirhabdus autotrophica]|uniref:Uncharacterized protein DUF4129 n=1 Tax=Sulfurirhabdus autotrophica TaxID=1706046 RepID=A0A4R3YFC3_9PROT|nr:DUF3488 and transglutaminase-like domain-containing protein [Sulfurirhabdus autotrophica]TCV90671.1 uncharacterized protein DUF4129 [Sulfurirhabdus autotrophica]
MKSPIQPISVTQTSDLQWILVSLSVVIAPHMFHLPIWVSLMYVAVVLWRYLIIEQKAKAPSKWILQLITVFAGIGIYFSHGTLFGREAGVSLLIIMAALKLMELRTRGDIWLVVFLSYFLILTSFLFSESILYAIYLLVTVFLVTATLVGVNHPNGTLPVGGRARIAAVLIAQAIPAMIILFVLFPRLPGPIWSLPRDAHSARSGLSNSMSPGSISNLSLSDAIAFRVTFQGAPPNPSQLYWRGPVLWDFDGKTWSTGTSTIGNKITLPASGKMIKYSITLEPHNKPWLLALDLPISVSTTAKISSDFQLITNKTVNERIRYDATSILGSSSEGELEASRQERALKLPKNENNRSIDLAREWRANSSSDEAVVNRALSYFRNQPFVYTLRPKLLGENPVDDFMFNTQRGFCEHYAGSFVFLMRAAGIPARVVTGYQGGELNPLGNYMIVRQAHAHAWAEVWLPKKGWTRVDPTAAVSPDRIEKGIASALPAGDPNPLLLRAESPWLSNFIFSWDTLNNAWNQWVISYNQERQLALLSRLWNQPVSWREIGLSIAGAMTLLFLLLGSVMLWQMRAHPKDNIKQQYDKFCAKLAKIGIARHGHEGPIDFAKRAVKLRPELTEKIQDITNLYVTLRYGNNGQATELEHLKQLVKKFAAPAQSH